MKSGRRQSKTSIRHSSYIISALILAGHPVPPQVTPCVNPFIHIHAHKESTEEQKLALESTAASLEFMNTDVSDMVEGIQGVTETSRDILNNAKMPLEKAERASGQDTTA